MPLVFAGYWAFDIKNGEPWVWGSWDYAVRAAGWCRTHGIQVMMDLHGAPGSQVLKPKMVYELGHHETMRHIANS